MVENEQRLNDTQRYWDGEAASFDNEPDHGLREPAIRAAWRHLLKDLLPPNPAAILDIGCGTGSLSVLFAEMAYEVTGIDLSPNMVSLANTKAESAGYAIQFHVMDAAFPKLQEHQFDVVVCRHLLWALPNTDQVLQRWASLLKSGGRIILIEGFWYTGGGLHSQDIVDAMPASLNPIAVHDLSSRSDLWGKEVTDERFVVVAHVKQG